MTPAVRPFPIDSVPRLARRDLNVMRFLRAQLGPAAGAAFGRWARAGDSPGSRHAPAVAIESIRSADAAEIQTIFGSACWSVVLDGPAGSRAGLALDAALVTSLQTQLLRHEAPPAVWPLTPGQHGLVLYCVASLLQELGSDCAWTVSIAEPGACGRLADGILVSARIVAPVARGKAWLLIPRSALAAAGATGAAANQKRARVCRLATLPVACPIAVARLRLPAEEVDLLRAGDIILSADVPLVRSMNSGHLRVGAGGFSVCLSEHALTITGQFSTGELPMTSEPEQNELASQIPVQLSVEVGQLRLSAAEIMKLEPGDVLTLDRPLSTSVELRAGDKLIGRGELVDVEGEAGVRLTSIAL
jgi:type III secretion system YscQ/HrcQ family protein